MYGSWNILVKLRREVVYNLVCGYYIIWKRDCGFVFGYSEEVEI